MQQAHQKYHLTLCNEDSSFVTKLHVHCTMMTGFHMHVITCGLIDRLIDDSQCFTCELDS